MEKLKTFKERFENLIDFEKDEFEEGIKGINEIINKELEDGK